MKKRLLLVILAMLGTGVVVFCLLALRGGSDIQLEAVTSSSLPYGAWSWSFRVPRDVAKAGGISLVLRTRTFPSPANASYEMPPRAISKESAGREYAGTSWLGTGARAGSVSIQLLDLSKIGVVSSKTGQDLRVLAKLTMGGTTADLAGDAIFLPSGHFAANCVPREGKWDHNELRLMSFYVEDDGRRSQYDVVLEARE